MKSAVSYFVQEKITGGWFTYHSHRLPGPAKKRFTELKAAYPAPKKFRLIKRTITDEVIA